MDLERREVRLTQTKILSAPGAFSGYGAVFNNEDDLGDVIQEGAFSKSLKERWPKMLLHHGGGLFGGSADGLLPVGEWTEMEENRRGLKLAGQLFALNTERGQYIYEGLKAGSRGLDGLSIGYETKDFIPKRPVGRTLTEIALWEVSIVTFPANPKARVTAVKSLTVEELRELEGALRDGGLSRADALKGVVAFKSWLQRDAGAPKSGPRDEAAPDVQDILDLLDRNTAFLIREALRR